MPGLSSAAGRIARGTLVALPLAGSAAVVPCVRRQRFPPSENSANMNRLAIIPLLVCGIAARAEVPAPARDTLPAASAHRIDEVVVTGTRTATELRDLPATVSVVDRRTLAQDSRTSLLPTLTEQVPGLFVTGRGIMGYGVSTGAAGGMTLRGIGGSPTTGVLVLIDGQPQYMGLMGHPIADACRTQTAERVEVVRGPASVLYGSNALGGVINIITRRTHDEGVHTDVDLSGGSYGTFQSELTNRVRSGRFTSTVTASYDRTDGHRADMGFEQYGGYARLGCEVSKHWELAADVQLTHFNASNPGPVSAPILDNDSRITRGRAALSVRNDYGRTTGAVHLYCNWGRHRINDGYSPGEAPLDYRFNSRDRMAGVSVYESFGLFRGSHLTLGVDWQYVGGKAWNRFLNGAPDRITADKTVHETAGYVDFRQRLSERLTLDAGLRLDHHSHVGTEWIPQGGLSLRIARSLLLKATVSKGFRYPTIREMYLFPPQNPDLKPERLMNYELSLQQTSADGRRSWAVSLYYIDGNHLIQTVRVDGRPLNVNTGRVENFGAEGEFACRLGSAWRLEANYSYLHMAWPVLAAPEHKLYAGASLQLRRWSANTGVQYIRGLYTALMPATREEEFAVWNATVDFRASQWCSLYVRGENLLARRYEINAGYPMPKATVLAGVRLHF